MAAMLPTGPSSSANPYEHIVEDDDIIDPDDGAAIFVHKTG